MAEMLLQSQDGELHLLPALPSAWHEGNVTGLRGRGGFIVDIEWANGSLKRATIKAMKDGPCHLRYKDHQQTVDLKAGESCAVDAMLKVTKG